MHNISIYLSSRNNYTLLEEFIQRNPKLSKYYFVNVDDHSETEQITLGKHICEKHGIPFITNKARGLQNAAQTMPQMPSRAPSGTMHAVGQPKGKERPHCSVVASDGNNGGQKTEAAARTRDGGGGYQGSAKHLQVQDQGAAGVPARKVWQGYAREGWSSG
jgi:hypothetical protein